MRSFLVCCGLLSAALLLAGCSQDPLSEIPPPGPIPQAQLQASASSQSWNLLLITLDTTREDRLGAERGGRALTPRLDQLAEQAVVFDHLISPIPVTLPAHATILTGLNPNEHGVRNNGTFVLPDEQITLAEVLTERGYATGATAGALPVAAQFGLAQGFDHYDDDFPESSRLRAWQSPERRGNEVTDRALAWIKAHAQEPFFHWAHYFDPHSPYAPPAPFDSLFAETYDGEIAYMDAQIGRLIDGLDEMGLRERTWILIVGDHGEALGDHGELTHSMLIYGATQHVPGLLLAPVDWDALSHRQLRGRRIAEVIGLRDLAPTMIDALGIGADALHASGSSLLPLIAESWTGPAVVYVETLVPYLEYAWSELRGIRTAHWAYVRAPEPELYDLKADPGEETNVYYRFPEVAARLSAWCDHFVGAGDETLETGTLDQETIDKLRSLGYVAGAAPEGSAVNDKDPKALMRLYRRIDQARTAHSVQSNREAKIILRSVLDEDPGNPAATRLLGNVLLYLADGEGAYRAFDELVIRFPDDTEARINRARAAIIKQSLAEAEADLTEILAKDPRNADARALYAQILTRTDRVAEARRLLTDALARAPEEMEYLVQLAQIEWALGNQERARDLAEEVLAADSTQAGAHAILAEWLWGVARTEAQTGAQNRAQATMRTCHEHLEAALALDPTQPMAAFRMAWLARQNKNNNRAQELYERVVSLQPDNSDAHFNLGNILREKRQFQKAAQHYETARALGLASASLYINYGITMAMLNNKADALELWEKALELAEDEATADGIRRNIDMLRQQR